MDNSSIKKLFEEFIGSYDAQKREAVWAEQSKTFREFWQSRILANKTPVSEAEFDPIIRLIDVKARGFNRETDEAVAHVGLYQGVWYRIFNDLREKENIRATLDKIFNSDDDHALIDLTNRLEKENEKNKNGLTGKNANALNAMLFINNPGRYLSCVSLSHRFQIMEAFGFSNPASYKTYGERVVGSNRDIIAGFRDKLGIDAAPRTISLFLYLSPGMKALWWKKDTETEPAVAEEPETSESESDFVIEKHLEDFLVANWESTELGKSYELIEEDGEIVSQQYRTEIGLIDLLVKEKKGGNYVVIELKKGQTSDDTIGQLARYMGWIKANRANGKKVKGIIIAGASDKRLKYALEMVPDTEMLLYRINFSLERPKK